MDFYYDPILGLVYTSVDGVINLKKKNGEKSKYYLTQFITSNSIL